MLLREAIEKCQGKTIRIGASTGFIYIGPADAKTVEVAAREERLKAENTLKKALEELTAIHDKAFLIRMQSVLTSSIRASVEKNERFKSKLIDGTEEEIKKLKKLTPSEISKKATADFVSSRDRYIGQLLSSFTKATDYAGAHVTMDRNLRAPGEGNIQKYRSGYKGRRHYHNRRERGR